VRKLLVLLLGLAVLGVPALASSASAAGATRVTLTAAPTSVTLGQTVVFKVRTVRAVKGQRVALQRKVGASWVTDRSGRLPATRRLNLSVAPTLGTSTYRVRLARKGAGSAARSRLVQVVVQAPAPASAQSATFIVPSTAIEGTSVTAASQFSPVSPGRPVELQRSAGGPWATVATTPEDALGRTSFSLTGLTAGVFQYRVVAVTYGGLAAYVSDVRTLTVTQPAAFGDDTVLVSHDVNGGPANSASGSPSISDDGRYVAYASNASDLVANDLNGKKDVFLWDRATDTTVLVSRTKAGGGIDSDADGPVVSGNGRYVGYSSNAHGIGDVDNPNNRIGIFRWDRLTGETVQIAMFDGGYADPGVSLADLSESGEIALVLSSSHQLTNDDWSTADADTHLFRWSGGAGDVTSPFLLIDKTAAGKPGDNLVFNGEMNSDGSTIAFTSWSSNLDVSPDTPVSVGPRHAYVWRVFDSPRLTALAVDETHAAAGDAYVSSVSGTGGRVGISYANADLGIPTGGQGQAMVWQRLEAPPVRLASHEVGSTNPGTSLSVDLSLSSTGLTGVLRSFAPLDAGDTNGFYDLYSWQDGVVARIAQAYNGAQPNNNAGLSDLSRDGDTIAFESYATNLTPVVTTSRQVFVAGVP
jgi:hypothetical protein